ncbi:MAG: hypothetical protein F8N36_12650 [Desulfovibrio sp.]|uniref:hypothetical protein n=1 Tax=Desulfovibrio sp. TaxID=885 RepID=UPI00135DE285|nr:hypothetical protein [Desulfovibrio sp.]MTJ93694.1 hypothetical protein [Desulfovibrio sp.]
MLYALNHAHRKGRQIVKREKEIFALMICVFVEGGLAGKFLKPADLKENQESVEVLFPNPWGMVLSQPAGYTTQKPRPMAGVFVRVGRRAAWVVYDQPLRPQHCSAFPLKCTCPLGARGLCYG